MSWKEWSNLTKLILAVSLFLLAAFFYAAIFRILLLENVILYVIVPALAVVILIVLVFSKPWKPWLKWGIAGFCLYILILIIKQLTSDPSSYYFSNHVVYAFIPLIIFSMGGLIYQSSMRPWVKGGFFGLFILANLIFFVNYIPTHILAICKQNCTDYQRFEDLEKIAFFFDFIGRYIFCNGGVCGDAGRLIHLLTAPISFFVEGAVVGFAYGYIFQKSKNKVLGHQTSYILKWVIIILTVCLLILMGIEFLQSQKTGRIPSATTEMADETFPPDLFRCISDQDCVIVPGRGCCGCATVINNEHEAWWYSRKVTECPGRTCEMCPSKPKTFQCIRNLCMQTNKL